jgi:hypothetical protein
MGWQSQLALHHRESWIHLYKIFMLRSYFANRLHNSQIIQISTPEQSGSSMVVEVNQWELFLFSFITSGV